MSFAQFLVRCQPIWGVRDNGGHTSAVDPFQAHMITGRRRSAGQAQPSLKAYSEEIANG